ncbi:MAG: glycosyltransferase family 4 protein [Pseudomonadota bacterium]
MSEPAPARYDHHIDRFNGSEIAGWVVDTHDHANALMVEFLIAGVPAGIAKADMVRADVERAGRGPRHCGFHWAVPEALARIAIDDGKPIEMRVVANPPVHLETLSLAQDPIATGAVREAIRPALEAAIVAAGVTMLQHGTARPQRSEPGTYPLHERMFSSKGPSAPGFGRALSPYLDYTHKRMRMERSHPLDGSEATKNGYLHWYCDQYSFRRRPMRTPLGADEISYLNEPVTLVGMPYKVSRASLSWAVAGPSGSDLLPILSQDHYDKFVAWWCGVRAGELHLEDCLVPDYYVEAMRRMTHPWMGKNFPPSVFMEARFHKDKRLHIFDGYREHDRILYHLWYLLEAVEAPGLIRFVPTKNLNAMFDGPRGGTLFDRLIQSIHDSGTAIGEIFNAERYADLLWLRGFDLTRRRFRFRDAKGNRFEAARFPPAAKTGRVDLQVIGPFEKSSGLGQASRLSAETLKAAGIAANYVDFGLDNPAPVGMSTKAVTHDTPKPARVNLIHLNGETVPIALAYLPDVFNGAYNIGYFFWELSTPAPAQHLALGLLDEVWVATDYGVTIYENHIDKPVHNVGMAVEPLPEPSREDARAYVSQRLPVGPDTFVVLAIFDSFSFLERKNPHGVVDAFRAAFGPDEDVRLVIKTHNRDFVADRHQAMRWEYITEIAAEDPRISILNETLKFSDLIKLKKGSDCYVSLHRSEGWGFGLIEAMNVGTPVLTTAYSGNMDFTKPDNAWLVDYDLVEPGPNEYIFVERGQVWADPKQESAVAALREIRDNPEERLRRAANARTFVAENFSIEAQAKKYRTRLDAIMASLDAAER